jgi:GT2 family glycosyltransferase
MTGKLLAIIVLYKVNPLDSPTYQSLLLAVKAVNSVLDLIIYDNSPESVFINNESLLNITYIADCKNSGISKAYNIASRIALERNKEWLLLLDQDSIMPNNFLEVLINSIKHNSSQVVFAPILKQNNIILSPCKFNLMKGRAFKNLNYGSLPIKNIAILNSGMCVNLKAYLQIGGYNENVNLDFSDHYFINQVRKKYSSVFVIPAVIKHELSSNSPNEETVFRRFNQYCIGVKAFLKSEKSYNILFFWTFLRGVKLFVRYKKMKYLTTFFNIFYTKE